MTAVLLPIFFVLVILGLPIAFALGLAAMGQLIVDGNVSLRIIPQRIYNGVDSFALMAIPFFILAGELMGSGGILDRLLAFARLIVGRLRGGLAHVNIMSSMLFGGLNGSAIADTSAIGSLMIPATTKEYNDGPFAAAITACSSVVGPIVPPSIPFIIYALVAGNVSVGGLFAAGIVPGILIGLGMMVLVYIRAVRHGYPRIEKRYGMMEALIIIRRFGLAALLPVIMVGGILTGVFTPTESGAVAVFYAIMVGFLVTRELTFDRLTTAVFHSAIVSSVVFLMIGVANIVSWIWTTQLVPQTVGAYLQSVISDPVIFMVVVAVILLVVGLFLEAVAAMIMFGPILVPLASLYGIDPIHFGLVVVLSLLIGLVTPPVGICLFVASGISQVSIEKIFVAAWPYVLWLIAVLAFIIFAPDLFMWVPRSLGF